MQYTLVKGWAKLVKQGGTVFAMEAALAEASASVLEKCGHEEQAAPLMDFSHHEEQAAPGDEEADGNKRSDAEQSATA